MDNLNGNSMDLNLYNLKWQFYLQTRDAYTEQHPGEIVLDSGKIPGQVITFHSNVNAVRRYLKEQREMGNEVVTPNYERIPNGAKGNGLHSRKMLLHLMDKNPVAVRCASVFDLAWGRIGDRGRRRRL
ncbi:MAG: hypothetical protein AABX11_00505 [Nanoarchaeota archaeon]